MAWEIISNPMTNGDAFEIFKEVKSSKIPWRVPADHLSKVLGVDISPVDFNNACSVVKGKRGKLSKSKRDAEKLQEFLQSPFKFTCVTEKGPTQPLKKRRTCDAIVVEEAEKSSPGSPLYSSLMKDYLALRDELQRKEAEYEELRKSLEKEKKRRVQQDFVRSQKSAALWRDKYKELKKVVSVDQEVKRLKSSLSTASHHHKTVRESEAKERESLIKSHKEQLGLLKERISFLEDALERSKEEIEAIRGENEKQIDAMHGKAYSFKVRMAVYEALQRQCPVEHVGKLIQSIVQILTGRELARAPSAATAARMGRELGTIGDLQTADVLLKNSHCTLAWDATELAGAHINEVHIAAPNASSSEAPRTYHTISIAQLPGGTTEDYTKHVKESLEDLANLHAKYSGTDLRDTASRMAANITASISDRVAVNNCVSIQLKTRGLVNKDCLHLNCNVHPLDSLSSKSREALKTPELAVTGHTFGRDCVAANLLHGLSKLRYKQGSGDPVGFKAFFEMQKIPLSCFPRYVGNRMHIIFHLAGVVIHLHTVLLLFLKDFSKNRGGLTSALKKDLENEAIMSHLLILGLVGKIITGPWMTVFYTEESANLEMCDVIRSSIDSVENIEKNPQMLLTATTDIFNRTLSDDDDVLKSLRSGSTFQFDSAVALKVISNILVVLKSQLDLYVTTDFCKEDLERASSCPSHNMQAERILGSADHEVHRAPNAKTDYIEAKVKAKTSRTLEWIRSKPADEQHALITFSTTATKRATAEKKSRQLSIVKELIIRMESASRKRDSRERNKLESQVEQLCQSGVTLEELLPLVPGSDVDVATSAFVGKNQDVIYCGTVLKLKKNRVYVTFDCGYFEHGCPSDTYHTESCRRSALIVDALFGDMSVSSLQ
ncbi:hypothetical protein CAPTEDRAFT_196087 [Capitella teleta]|uniref:Uncharacterized protein n=1 Tax=Capitella teleta TaxID=283909 RepID=R7U1Z5_CAPTE|nr:hypothetical protein CAPTEDRAFT_196087 [Capitella teleta]|eukprot:ELT97200.1 hypothetical protein CAPTEDRAFT_196087 [Capitella teleta]